MSVAKGEFFIIMGLSGSGKSTLLRNLIRLVNPTVGNVHISGRNIVKFSEYELLTFRKDMFGMVFQHYGLLPHLNVLDNAAFGLKIRNLPKEEQEAKAMEALATVGLGGWETSWPRELSGGMQQRVGLARALANDPEILLMDEPFSGLDPLIRRQMQDEFVELQNKLQKTIVFVTHDLSEALKLGDRIAILHDGVVAQIGTPEEIVTNPADDYIREFVQGRFGGQCADRWQDMVKPEVLLYAWEGPKTALTILKKRKTAWSLCRGQEFKLMGVASQDGLEKFITETNPQENARLAHPVVRAVPSVNEDSVLQDLFGVVTANPYPVPVVSETGRLIGIVKTDDIFEAMATDGDVAND